MAPTRSITWGAPLPFAFLQVNAGPTINVGPQTGPTDIRIKVVGGGHDWIVELTRSFIRIAAVTMSIFIVNILVSFARYNMRVANFLEARADCLVITAGEADKFTAFLPSISVDPLDFGKTPMNPYDTYLEAIRGIMPGSQSSKRVVARKPTPKSEEPGVG
jgi:hypothetical protein